ncbi:MAG: hypothetical protein ACOZDD_00170 [Bacteroidota bacterium]
MKENRKLIANLPIYFLIIIFISGCNLVEKKEGFQIPESLRTEIWKTESDICTSIMKREYDKALQLFNDSLAVTGNDECSKNGNVSAVKMASSIQ